MAGKYTDIIEVVAPSPVVLGQTVTVRVKAKNIYTAQLYFYIIGVVEASDGTQTRFIDWVGAKVNPGAVLEASGSFIPAGSPGTLTVSIYTWYVGTDGYVHSDDSESRTITVIATQPNQTLEVDITPTAGGCVTTSPASVEGRTTWNNGSTGKFAYGTNVQVTAIPNTGYVFDHWSDEIVGGTSTSNPAYVQPMTEHRAVKAHFTSIDMRRLEVDITPSGRGYVITDKASIEGRTEWSNGDSGQYPKGTVVQVTAYPYTGYEFDHWSDQIEGGVSYQNPAYVKPLSENRSVKLHLKEIAGGDGGAGATFKKLSIDGWGNSPSPLGTSPVEVPAGGTLYVKFSLVYSAVQVGATEVWISLVISPGRDRTWKYSVPLQIGTDLTFTDTVAIPILSTESTLGNDTYDLWCEINNVIDDKAAGAVTLTGMPAGILGGLGDIGNMLVMMMVMMMMMLMMEQTRELYEPAGTPPRPKPISEAIGRGAKGAARYAVKKVTEYFEGGEGD